MHARVGGFYEFLPTGYNGTTLFPCLIALHGRGEQGNGNSELNDILSTGLSQLINLRMGTGDEFPFPFIVICPQYYTEDTGVYPSGFVVQSIINYVKANYAVDTTRIHLTGLSWGGAAVVDWGDLGTITDVASITAVCPASSYNSSIADKYKAVGMPFWFIHGLSDPVVAYSSSSGWVSGLNGGTPISPAARLTSLTRNYHNYWNEVYEWIGGGFADDAENTYDQEVFDWMSLQSRAASNTLVAGKGVFTITGKDASFSGPGSDFSIVVESGWKKQGNDLSVFNTWPGLAGIAARRMVMQVGNSLSVWNFDGADWGARVNQTITGGRGGVSPLEQNAFACVVENANTLRKYSFNPSNDTLSTVGNAYALGSVNDPRVCSLSTSRVVVVDATTGGAMRVLDFDGTNWTLVATHTGACGFAVRCAGLSKNRWVTINGDDGVLRTFELYGTTIIERHTQNSTFNLLAMAGLNEETLVVDDTGNDTIKIWKLNSGTWEDTGRDISTGGGLQPDLCVMPNNEIGYIASTQELMRLYNLPNNFFTKTGEVNSAIGKGVLAAPGTFNVTGNDASLQVNRRLTAEQGSFTVTTNNVQSVTGNGTGVNPASFTITGKDANLTVSRRAQVEQFSMSIIGNTAFFTYTPYSPGNTNYSIAAEKGSFGVNVNNATLNSNRSIACQKGIFLITTGAIYAGDGINVRTIKDGVEVVGKLRVYRNGQWTGVLRRYDGTEWK